MANMKFVIINTITRFNIVVANTEFFIIISQLFKVYSTDIPLFSFVSKGNVMDTC